MSEQSAYRATPGQVPAPAGYPGHQPGTPMAPPVRARANVLGRISLGVMVVAVLLTQVGNVIGLRMVATMPVMTYAQIAATRNVVTLLLSLVALVLGIIGLLRPGLPRGAAAAGTALAASSLFAVLLIVIAGSTF